MTHDLKIQNIIARCNKIPCSFRRLTYSTEWVKIRKSDYCPVCDKKLAEDEDFYLAINNNKLFPNCLIHTACIEQVDTVGLKFMNFVLALETVSEKYAECTELKNESVRLQTRFNKLHRPWRI